MGLRGLVHVSMCDHLSTDSRQPVLSLFGVNNTSVLSVYLDNSPAAESTRFCHRNINKIDRFVRLSIFQMSVGFPKGYVTPQVTACKFCIVYLKSRVRSYYLAFVSHYAQMIRMVFLHMEASYRFSQGSFCTPQIFQASPHRFLL